MAKRSLILALLSAPMILTACEGYEMVLTDAFPYGNQRTAGSGVAYVLARMMPEKELNLEPATTSMTPVVREREVQEIQNEEAVQDLRNMFAKEQRK